MFRNHQCLLIDPDQRRADSFFLSLTGPCNFAECLYAESFFQGLITLTEAPLSVCFISEVFPYEKVQLFIDDCQKIIEGRKFAFVLLKLSQQGGFDSAALRGLGVELSITRDIHSHDIALLTELAYRLNKKTPQEELEASLNELEHSLNKILDEIDNSALDLRRGCILAPLTSRIQVPHLEHRIFSHYFEKLINLSDTKLPPQTVSLSIPDHVFHKGLPKLSKDSYSGVSRRVFKKLQKFST